MKKLYVARHGETEFNVQNRYAGSMDVALNQKGIKQARVLAKQIEDFPIDVVITSTKKRAMETARILNKKLKKPMIYSDDLVERNLGIFEGLTREEVSKQYPKLWQEKTIYKINSIEHKGESVEQVAQRAQKVIDDISEKHSDKSVLLVTHGYISRMIHKIVKNLSYEQASGFLLGNCEIIEYDLAK